MKVGDLVEHFVDGAYGIVIRVEDDASCDYPYLIQFFDGCCDWFSVGTVKVI